MADISGILVSVQDLPLAMPNTDVRKLRLGHSPHGTIRDMIKCYIAYNDRHEGEEWVLPTF